jgi:hypothetical protein
MSEERTIDPRDLTTIEDLRIECERLRSELRQVEGALNLTNPPSIDLAAVLGYEAGLEDSRRANAAEVDRLQANLGFSLEREERLQAALTRIHHAAEFAVKEFPHGDVYDTDCLLQVCYDMRDIAQVALASPDEPYETSRSAAAEKAQPAADTFLAAGEGSVIEWPFEVTISLHGPRTNPIPLRGWRFRIRKAER